jgi:NADP-reducing hydrogenase subunit HndB
MAKLKSAKDLEALREKVRSDIEIREGPKEIQITVHMGTCGIAAGARTILNKLAEELAQAGVGNVTLKQSGCLGLCDREPMFTLKDAGGAEYRYGNLDGDKVTEIVRRHVIGKEPVSAFLIND